MPLATTAKPFQTQPMYQATILKAALVNMECSLILRI